MPAIAYAGRPFFASALAALRQRRTNMDVPISLGVLLVTGMSLAETIGGGAHTYFDSAITLLFFLLVGRVLDHRARGQARATAEQLLALRATDVAVVQADGTIRRRAQEQVAEGDRVLVATGERIGVDGVLERGSATLDTSLVTGESLPVRAEPGTAGLCRHVEPWRHADDPRDSDRRSHIARRMRAADRGRRNPARPFRRAHRPGGATLCSGGASLRAADVSVVVLRRRRARRAGAADRERGADHHLPLRARAGGAGGAGDRDRAAVSGPECC